MIQISLGSHEMKIMYNINNGPYTEFWVPGAGQNMRWAAYSVSLANFLIRLFWEFMSTLCHPPPGVHSATDFLLGSIPMISVYLVSSLVTILFGRT